MKRKHKDKMKKPGRYSVAAPGRVLARPDEEPPLDPLRDKVADEVREALVRALPNPSEVADETTADSLIEGMMQVAAELTAAAPPGVRQWQRDRAIRYFTKAVIRTVGAWHRRMEGRTAIVDTATARAAKEEIAEEGFTLEAMEEQGPVLLKYIKGLRNIIRDDLIKEDDPPGSATMLLYALQEIAAEVVARAPEGMVESMEEDGSRMYHDRIRAKRLRLKEKAAHDPDDAADRQLQADALETVPAKDDRDL